MPNDFSFRRAQDAQRNTQLRFAEMQRTLPTATAVPWDVEISSTDAQIGVTAGTGLYVRANHLIVAWATLTLAAASIGTGDYLISVPAQLAGAVDGGAIGGTWEYRDVSSPNTEVWGHVFPFVGGDRGKVKLGYLSGYPTGSRVYAGANAPWALGNGDVLHITVIAKVTLSP